MTMPSAKLKCGAALRLAGSRVGLMYSPLFRVTLKVKALIAEISARFEPVPCAGCHAETFAPPPLIFRG